MSADKNDKVDKPKTTKASKPRQETLTEGTLQNAAVAKEGRYWLEGQPFTVVMANFETIDVHFSRAGASTRMTVVPLGDRSV